ncbi:MAG: 50S ribosomal protein L11 methyltransferase [Cytophagaceae bacterium]
MEYLEIKIGVAKELSEIIIAELDGIGFDSFAEHETTIDAYIEEGKFSKDSLYEILKKYGCDKEVTIGRLEKQNWNQEWEKNFDPVIINEHCIVRAPFHQVEKKFEYEIILNPRMAFGTGHHETTAMVLSHQLDIDHSGKRVLDAGSGTGILSIMACKLNAAEVIAFDIDEWAYENIFENIHLNGCANKIQVYQGDLSLNEIKTDKYDIILANINKNVLLNDISGYKHLLANKGILVMSGFYESDLKDIDVKARELGLSQNKIIVNNNWCSVVYLNQ